MTLNLKQTFMISEPFSFRLYIPYVMLAETIHQHWVIDWLSLVEKTYKYIWKLQIYQIILYSRELIDKYPCHYISFIPLSHHEPETVGSPSDYVWSLFLTHYWSLPSFSVHTSRAYERMPSCCCTQKTCHFMEKKLKLLPKNHQMVCILQ